MFADTQLAHSAFLCMQTGEGLNGVLHYELILFKRILYRFSKELDACYTNLNGSAEYHLLYENDLNIKVEMTSGGHAIVTGVFQERPDKHNILQFEFDTDQSCLLSVIQDIGSLKVQYGDMEGLRNK